MKLTKFFSLFLIISLLTFLFACEDETKTIGSVIAPGEVEISIDTFYFDLGATPVYQESFDSRSGNHMIGNIYMPGYGSLSCAFVTRLMPAADIQVADSLLLPERVDSCKLIMAANRSEITGDSLAPQRMSVYMLHKQLPSDISNTFDPEGYYDPSSPLGSLSYTVSNIAASDSVFYNGEYIQLEMNLPVDFGREIFRRYKETPSIFQWPQSFAKEFVPGLYVKPTFGNACIANISQLLVAVFYHSKELTATVTEEGDTVTKIQNILHTALPFVTSPEVLSSNNIKFTPSDKIKNFNDNAPDGDCVVTTPGGYIASFSFPIKTIIDRYKEKNIHLSTVNDLLLYIPANEFEADSEISMVENILLIKTSEMEEFFAKNKIPDNITSFTGVYETSKSRYVFNSLRQYLIDMLQKDTITEEDMSFTLVPVELTTESNTNTYYGTTTTYVTKCVPYTVKPTMTLLHTGNAMVEFSFSTQMID